MTTSNDDLIITNADAERPLDIPPEVLLRNDPDATAIAAIGSATLSGGKVIYTTPADFPANGGSFVYQATDGTTLSDLTTVTVTGVAGDTVTGTDGDDILVADATTTTPTTTVGDFEAPGSSNLAWSNFGERPTGNVTYVAQTFTATANAAQNLRFGLGGYTGSSAIEFRVHVVTSDGTGTDFQGGANFSPGQILFTSGPLVLPAGATDTEFNVALNGLALTPGQTYAFVLDAVTENGSEGLGTAIPRGGNSGYTGGDSFVRSVPANSSPADQAAHFAGNWTRIFNTDLAFEIEFGSPPVNTTLDGRDGNDSLVGDFGAETLLGGAGEDWLYGLAGEDRLEGGADNDRVDGGGGNDRVVYRIGEGVDTVDGGAERLGGRDTLEVRNETGTAREIRVSTISGGSEIDPTAADAVAANATDGIVQVRAAGSSDAFVDAVRFDEIEDVAIVTGAGDRVTVEDIVGTAVSHNPIAITGAAGNEIVDVIAGRRVTFDGSAGSGDMLRLDGRWSDYEIRTETRNGELWYRLTPTATGALAGRPIAVEANDVEQFFFLGDNATIGTSVLLQQVPRTTSDTGGPVVEAGLDGPGTPTATGNVLTNDTDANPLDSIRVATIAAGTNGPPQNGNVGAGETPVVGIYGTLFIQSNGAWRYELDNNDPDTEALRAGDQVTDVFTYNVRDLAGLPALGRLTVDVQGARDPNTPPTNTDDNDWDWGEDDGAFPFFAGDFEAGFTDVDGDTLAAIRITALPDAAHSMLVFNGVAVPVDGLPFVIPFDQIEGNDESQGLWFRPADRSADYAAVIEFQSQDSWGDWSAASNTYTINIDAVNDAPSGVTLAANTVDENAQNGTVIGTLAAIDPDGDALTWTLHASAGGRFAVDANTGVVTVADGTLLNYEGQSSHTITVSASDGTLSTGQTQLTIQLNDVNDAPTLLFTANTQAPALTENFPSQETERGIITVVDDGLGAHNVSLSGPHADLFRLDAVNATGYRLYFRAGTVPNYEALSAYTVTVSLDDPAIGDSPEDTFDVTVPVADSDEAAVALSHTITIDEDSVRVLTVADFPYVDPEGVETPFVALNVLTGTGNGRLLYDRNGGDPSDALVVSAATIGQFQGIIPRSHIDAGWLWFVPDAHETGDDYASFLFAVQDSQGLSSVAQITFNVTDVNAAPESVSAGVSGDEDTAIAVTLSGTDSDGTVAFFRIATPPADGALFLDAAGTTPIDPDQIPAVNGEAVVYFVPTVDFGGTASFDYLAIDDEGLTDDTPATISITVAAVNDAPEAQDGSASGDEDTVIAGTAMATDIDNTPEELTYSLVGNDGGALHGSVVMNLDGSYSYTPDPGFNGTDTFQFQASDGTGSSNAATITIDVMAVDDPAGGAVSGNPLTYTENQAPAAIDPLIVVTDPDSSDLAGATIAITGGFVGGEDVLGFADQNGIAGVYDAGTGVLTLTGVSSLADYQAALRSVTYFNSSNDPSVAPRTVTFAVDDGTGMAGLGDVGVTVLAVDTAPDDFDGDGRSDVFWRSDDGVLVLWEMDGPTIAGRHVVDASGMPDYWQVLDAADFDGDGETDVLWQDDAGVVVLWRMSGPTVVGSEVIAGTPEFGAIPDYWHFAGSGDFNGDGNSDMIWRDDAGTIVLWEMDGATVIGNSVIGTLGSDWQAAETGDFNGDGQSDILWRNRDGTVRLWEMDGSDIIGDTDLGTFPHYWQIAGSGDYNGDRRADILWRDDLGMLVMWEMDGPSVIGNSSLGVVPAWWHVVSSGDYNGDRNADILWRDDLGSVVLWEMDGPTVLSQTDIATIPAYWHIV